MIEANGAEEAQSPAVVAIMPVLVALIEQQRAQAAPGGAQSFLWAPSVLELASSCPLAAGALLRDAEDLRRQLGDALAGAGVLARGERLWLRPAVEGVPALHNTVPAAIAALRYAPSSQMLSFHGKVAGASAIFPHRYMGADTPLAAIDCALHLTLVPPHLLSHSYAATVRCQLCSRESVLLEGETIYCCSALACKEVEAARVMVPVRGGATTAVHCGCCCGAALLQRSSAHLHPPSTF